MRDAFEVKPRMAWRPVLACMAPICEVQLQALQLVTTVNSHIINVINSGTISDLNIYLLPLYGDRYAQDIINVTK